MIEIVRGDGRDGAQRWTSRSCSRRSSGWSPRWDRYQNEGILFHLKDRKDGEFALAPTAEEAVTDMVRRSVTSWRQLPFNLYQIRTKFRDEIRPRFGLLRGREFLMKDAYSFDLDQKGLDAHYRKMDGAYRAIFDRCGLDFAVVQADSGAIGGSASEEFMVVADTGEDRLGFAEAGDWREHREGDDGAPPSRGRGGGSRPFERQTRRRRESPTEGQAQRLGTTPERIVYDDLRGSRTDGKSGSRRS